MTYRELQAELTKISESDLDKPIVYFSRFQLCTYDLKLAICGDIPESDFLNGSDLNMPVFIGNDGELRKD